MDFTKWRSWTQARASLVAEQVAREQTAAGKKIQSAETLGAIARRLAENDANGVPPRPDYILGEWSEDDYLSMYAMAFVAAFAPALVLRIWWRRKNRKSAVPKAIRV